MKIKKNSKMLWLIQSQTTATPKSLCTFFWLFVISLASIPFSWPTFLFNLINNKRRFIYDHMHALYGIMFVFISIIAGESIIEKGLHIKTSFIEVLYWHPVFFFALLICGGGLVGVIFLLIKIGLLIEGRQDKKRELEFDKFKKELNSEPPKPKEPSLFRQYLKAKKEKVCPIIEYID